MSRDALDFGYLSPPWKVAEFRAGDQEFFDVTTDRGDPSDEYAVFDSGAREIAELGALAPRLWAFACDCRDDWDCDEDAHRHGTTCRKCAARDLIGSRVD